MVEVACPTCGSIDDAIPVWEDVDRYERGEPPKHIGCFECNELVRTGHG